ncbi:DNRLRE domain-containing protein [Nitrosomonas marina]|uniref:TGF-beta propeptide n=1 Tax=Nitrosomonas marina TaxID=917 RepID=A0A1H8CQK4_9PROT|nr:DNRLRE domain-containing protein [Nitrosomonas marina]SEM97433.1 TGF-beta propeptide [Nitrosomonas marina]
MQRLKHCLLSHYLLIILLITMVYGCANLRPLNEQTLTLEAERTASIFIENHHDTFGICSPFHLDRRGTRLYLWDEFVRQYDSTRPDFDINNLTGYEVAVTRGESCHLRIFETYQTAVKFDLSAFPPGAAVLSAELNVYGDFGPFDPPRSRGNREQCTVMQLGQATESWDAGIFRAGLPSGARLPISSTPSRPDSGPFDTLRSSWRQLDVTNTVSEWVRGVRSNYGFVITPDNARVLEFYNATDEGGYFCDLGISRFELVVTLAVPG